jgi:hypothetical protein
MKKEQVLGIVRHILTFAGGLLVLKGYGDAALIEEGSGALISLIGVVWSVLSKK